MALKFRRGTNAQKSGSLAFGEPYVNTDLGTLQIGGANGDITLGASGTGAQGSFAGISGSSLDITGNAKIDGNLTLGGQLTIGDATSDTVNVVAALSSSLIPQTTNAFDLGSASKIWRDLYISTGSIKFVAGTTVVKELSLSTLTALEAATGSANSSLDALNSFSSSQLTQNIALATVTGSLISSASVLHNASDSHVNRLNNIETFSGSQLTQNIALATISGSLISSASAAKSTNDTQDGRLAAIEAVSGTFARTNSDNTFSGLQSFNNINVEGTASFAYIQSTTGSSTAIGEEFIILNASTPSSNFAGIKVVDSGSSFTTASFVYDGLNNNWVFEKANVGSSDTSIAIFGPISTGGLGTELGLTQNKLPKAVSSHGHHIADSNITDDGSLITLGSNTTITGTLVASGTTLVSSSAQVIGILSSLNTYTGSNDTTNTTQTSRLDQLSTESGSAITRLTTLEVETANLEAFTSSINTTIKTRLDANTVISGSSQVTLSSTTGYDSVLNQAVLTTSTPTFGNLTINGTITATGDITAFFTSDKRHKNNIQTISNAVLKVKQLNGVTWEWNDDVNEVTKSTPKTGLIAQEVQQVLPQVVIERENGFLALDYSKMVGLLVEAIKEQQTQIDQLKAQIGSK